MYPKELEDLLKEYLTDGIITAKEREILLKKAESLGLNPEEFDLYIDAQVQKLDQEADAAARKQKGKECPYCGGVLQILADHCPHCGQTISVASSDQFESLMKEANKCLSDMATSYSLVDKDSKAMEKYESALSQLDSTARMLRLYYTNNPKVAQVLQELEFEKQKIDQKLKSQRKKNMLKTCLKTYLFGVMSYR